MSGTWCSMALSIWRRIQPQQHVTAWFHAISRANSPMHPRSPTSRTSPVLPNQGLRPSHMFGGSRPLRATVAECRPQETMRVWQIRATNNPASGAVPAADKSVAGGFGLPLAIFRCSHRGTTTC